jgi:hypothetical protein
MPPRTGRRIPWAALQGSPLSPDPMPCIAPDGPNERDCEQVVLLCTVSRIHGWRMVPAMIDMSALRTLTSGWRALTDRRAIDD